MRYRKGKRFGLREEEQSFIYWECRCLSKIDDRKRKKYLSAMEEAGGEYFKALKEFLTTDRNLTNVALRHDLSESTLFSVTKKFYEIAAKEKEQEA